jgi:iron complex outermembrane recepter protein
MISKFRHNLMLGMAAMGAAAVALTPAAAGAQTSTAESKQTRADDSANTKLEEIVVTGTLFRGSQAPVGSNLITVGRENLETAGATTTNELLATIPQITNLFNTVPNRTFNIALNQIQITRPNLRNLSNTTASSASTLVLMDGHRIASAGVTQASPDADLIPTGAIERVEVLLDGGSATYGADAVGGVINSITRRRFDGAKLDARYGTADNYWSSDANAIVGKDWGSGSAYIAYTFTKSDSLFGRDRDFIRNIDFSTGIPSSRTCDQSNITVGGVNYSGATLAPGTNTCDLSKVSTVIPEVKRHGALVSLFQEINDSMSVDVRSFYSRRETLATGPLTGSNIAITRTNPYYTPLGANPTAKQTASLSFAPALGNESAPAASKISEWGANAELKADVTSNWQVRTLLNYSETDSSSSIVGFNAAALNAAGAASSTATAINPYNIAVTNPQLLAALANNQVFAGQTKDQLVDARAIAEGQLFELPGGDLRIAAGYEYMHDELKQRIGNNIAIGGLSSTAFGSYARHVNSAFAELQIPIFGKGNALPGVRSLTLAASGRYDDYSDFGNTTNPKLALSYMPVEWFTLRGNWSKAFNAPTPLDQLGSQRNFISSFPFIAFVRPGDPVGFFSGSTVALQGSRPNLQPQTANSWSVGFDIDPPVVRGFHVSVNYYDVTFKNILGTPSPRANVLFASFPSVVQTNVNGLSPAQLRAFEQLAPSGPTVIEPLIAAGTLVYETDDFRTSNFGVVKVKGVDFPLSYEIPTAFGGLDASVNGSYMLSRDTQVSSLAPTVDELQYNTPKLLMTAAVGANIRNLRAQATWNYTAGYDVLRASTLPQDHVSSFGTLNFFFKYDLDFEGVLKNLSFTLNVNNVLDKDPPLFKLANNGGYDGAAGTFTLGREFILGAQAKF